MPQAQVAHPLGVTSLGRWEQLSLLHISRSHACLPDARLQPQQRKKHNGNLEPIARELEPCTLNC